MNFKSYKANYIKQATEMNLEYEIIQKQLEYAEILFNRKLPVIYDIVHLSKLTGYSSNYIYSVSNSQNHFYRYFKIPKKNGKYRMISEPLPNLKEIQHWILNEILYKCKTNPHSKAYVRGSSIKQNARFHQKQKKVLNIDIKDYFNSIKYYQVNNLFLKLGYYKSVARVLANLCCLNGSLPQGAPTSPMISNLITKKLDQRISGYTKKNNLRYTRYADDITISGNFNEKKVIDFVKYVLADEGFSPNYEKIYTQNQSGCQKVTGIVVNEKMQVSRTIRNNLRLEMYYINKYGLQEHLKRNNTTDPYYLNRLLGTCYYIYNINPSDKNVLEYIRKLKEIINSTNNLLN